jgi:hypothetical protein
MVFGLFGKKCTYCRNKIEKGREIRRDVRVPGYVGTHAKDFCCEEHADKYEEEVRQVQQQRSSGGCCG